MKPSAVTSCRIAVLSPPSAYLRVCSPRMQVRMWAATWLSCKNNRARKLVRASNSSLYKPPLFPKATAFLLRLTITPSLRANGRTFPTARLPQSARWVQTLMVSPLGNIRLTAVSRIWLTVCVHNYPWKWSSVSTASSTKPAYPWPRRNGRYTWTRWCRKCKEV